MEMLNAEKTKLAMINAGFGVTDLAKKTGMMNNTVSRLLKENKSVRLTTIGKIANALNIRAEELILKGGM